MSKVILITGVSSGFGKLMAENLADNGHIVYGTVRNAGNTSTKYHVLQMDLTDTLSIKNAVDTVIKNEGNIDVLINNAGMHVGGAIETTPTEYAKLQLDTNIMGLVYMLKEVLPYMRNKGKGTIINFGSIGGLMGLPFQGYYSASKFAIEGLTQVLRMELKSFNIKVIIINPGDFHTSNSANRRNYINTNESDPYHKQFMKTLSIIEKDESGGWAPEVLARKICKIVDSPNPKQKYVIASSEQKLAVFLNRVLPWKLFSKILEGHYGIK